MDVSTRTVSPMRQRMLEVMRMRGFEPKTQAVYLRATRKLAALLQRSPDTTTTSGRSACARWGAHLRGKALPAPCSTRRCATATCGTRSTSDS